MRVSASRASDERIYREIDRKEALVEGRRGRDLKKWGGVFDQPTVMTLHRLLSRGVIDSLDFPVSTGKEADVFKASDEDGGPLAVKVYRFSTPSFRRLGQYIEGDPRFRDVPKDHRALMHAWAQKEYRNLERFRAAGVDVPIPFRSLDNVVVMEYLAGKDGPARTMHDETPTDSEAAFKKLWSDYALMVKGASCVHADYSEYNCLMVNDVPRVIDCAQAVIVTHPMASEFLERDVRNLCNYFGRIGVDQTIEQLQEEARGWLDEARKKKAKKSTAAEDWK